MAKVVVSDDIPINKEQNVEKHEAGIKNVAVASDHKPINKKENVEKQNAEISPEEDVEKEDAGIKNVSSISKEKDAKTESGIKIVDAFDSEKEDKKDAIMKNVVASDVEKQTDIDLGISMDKLNLGPKKKLLVLPFTGFLVYRAHCNRPNTFPKNRHPDFCSGNYMIYKRQFSEGFLKFCFERFEVGIWSSALEQKMNVLLTNVMGEHKKKPLFTWDQKKCTKTNFMCLDNNSKPVLLKELDHVWSKHRSYSASNTLLITDPVKALLNPPNTTISFGSYDPENKEDDLLAPDGDSRVFLDGLTEADDVQTYVKDHPIGEPAITSAHTDWDYYSKIICAYNKTNVEKKRGQTSGSMVRVQPSEEGQVRRSTREKKTPAWLEDYVL